MWRVTVNSPTYGYEHHDYATQRGAEAGLNRLVRAALKLNDEDDRSYTIRRAA